jgi:hypothetical protein
MESYKSKVIPKQPADAGTHSTSSLKTGANLIYQGARLKCVEPAEKGRHQLVLVDVPEGAWYRPSLGDKIDLARWLTIYDDLRTILSAATRGSWTPPR